MHIDSHERAVLKNAIVLSHLEIEKGEKKIERLEGVTNAVPKDSREWHRTHFDWCFAHFWLQHDYITLDRRQVALAELDLCQPCLSGNDA